MRPRIHKTIQNKFDYKIVLLGDTGVGKSTLLMSCAKIFNVSPGTRGIIIPYSKFSSIKLHVLNHNIESYDDDFLHNVDGVIIVVDLTDPESFNNVYNYCKLINKDKNNEIPISLAFNKVDLKEKRKIYKMDMEKLADILQDSYYTFGHTFSISANDTYNERNTHLLKQLFLTLGESILMKAEISDMVLKNSNRVDNPLHGRRVDQILYYIPADTTIRDLSNSISVKNRTAANSSYLRSLFYTQNRHVVIPSEPPEELCCPISMLIMEDPVILPSGYTYDRDSIKTYYESGSWNGMCPDPITRQSFSLKDLIPNRIVKTMIDKWMKEHPDYKKVKTEALTVSRNRKTF